MSEINNINTVVQTGKLIVITGFSGAGKDTLVNMLLQKRSDFEVIVTHSSRPARPGEVEGKDHYFVKQETFEEMIQKGEMIEYVKYGSYYKGTSKKEFQKVQQGKNIIWRIDLLRAATFEETIINSFDPDFSNLLISNSVRILIKTPTYKSALKRYVKRDANPSEIGEFEKRLKRDIDLFSTHRSKFSNIVINKNNKAQEALSKIEKIIFGDGFYIK